MCPGGRHRGSIQKPRRTQTLGVKLIEDLAEMRQPVAAASDEANLA